MTGSKKRWEALTQEANDLGLTMRFVLGRVPVSRTSRSNYLRGRYFPSPKTAQIIADKLSTIRGMRRKPGGLKV